MTIAETADTTGFLDQQLRPWLLLHKAWWRRTYSTFGRAAWVELMKELYQAIGATSPLLRTAAETAATLGHEYEPFANWCREHDIEERDHDDWLLDDLATVGVDPGAVRSQTPHPDLSAIIGCQFLFAASKMPTALLGYFYMAECHPADTAALDRLRAEMKLPDTAMRTLRFHAAEDQEHQREIRELVSRYGQDVDTRKAMFASGQAYVRGWTSVYRRLYQQLVDSGLPKVG